MASNYQLFVAGDVLTASQVNTNLQRQSVIQCDAAADRTSLPSVEGMMAYQKDTDEYWVQAPAGTWKRWGAATATGVQTYTPQVDQGASTNIAKTINEARYVQQGSLVTVWINLAMTAAGTAGSAIGVTLPIAPSGHGTSSQIGYGQLYNLDITTRYVCTVERSGATSYVYFASDVSNGALHGATPSWALASGDIIRFVAQYTVA